MSALFKILVSLTMTLFSKKVLNSNRCISGLMSNLIKKSSTVSNEQLSRWNLFPEKALKFLMPKSKTCCRSWSRISRDVTSWNKVLKSLEMVLFLWATCYLKGYERCSNFLNDWDRRSSKLYIPSTLNIDVILWHTQSIVCAV